MYTFKRECLTFRFAAMNQRVGRTKPKLNTDRGTGAGLVTRIVITSEGKYRTQEDGA